MTYRIPAVLALAALLTSSLPAHAQISPPLLEAGSDLSASAPGMRTPRLSPGGGVRSPLLSSVPSGPATSETIELSLADAIDRALEYNLGVVVGEQNLRAARAVRLNRLAQLFPETNAYVQQTVQQTNLSVFGLPPFPGVPSVVGPFSLIDARVTLRQRIFDLQTIHQARESKYDVTASRHSQQDIRDTVVVIAANLYLEALAGASRIEAAQARLATAQAILTRAQNLRNAGVVAGIDVLRAQVQYQDQQQRLIELQNQFEKEKLNLARAIGLPLAQPFELSDDIPANVPDAPPLEVSLEAAFENRPDYLRAVAALRAAEEARKAAGGERVPAVLLDAAYGDIGRTLGNSHGTFAVSAVVEFPIFDGGRIRSNVEVASAVESRRRAELDALRTDIEGEVRTAYLDIQSSQERLRVAESARQLARQQLQQAEDRFTAGVTDSLEVVQAQEALATADENYISSLYSLNVARVLLIRAVGGAERAARQILQGGSR